AHGSAVDALKLAIKNKTAEVKAAIGRDKERRTDELQALEKQLAVAERNEALLAPGPEGTKRSAIRPEAAIASEVTGATYPLVLQLVPIAQGERSRWALYDVTTKGDKLGFAYIGDGKSDGDAVHAAFRALAADNEYGRGTLAYHVPDSIADASP